MAHERAGLVAQASDLIDVDAVLAAYHDITPDPQNPDQMVVFGTSGHRGSSLDGAFNDVPRWNFSRIPEVLGGGLGFKVTTEREMADALAKAHANTGSFSIIQVMLARDDHSPALKRLTASLAERVQAKG